MRNKGMVKKAVMVFVMLSALTAGKAAGTAYIKDSGADYHAAGNVGGMAVTAMAGELSEHEDSLVIDELDTRGTVYASGYTAALHVRVKASVVKNSTDPGGREDTDEKEKGENDSREDYQNEGDVTEPEAAGDGFSPDAREAFEAAGEAAAAEIFRGDDRDHGEVYITGYAMKQTRGEEPVFEDEDFGERQSFKDCHGRECGQQHRQDGACHIRYRERS